MEEQLSVGRYNKAALHDNGWPSVKTRSTKNELGLLHSSVTYALTLGRPFRFAQ